MGFGRGVARRICGPLVLSAVQAWAAAVAQAQPLPAPAASAVEQPHPGCSVAFGHGRNFDDRDPRANQLWNELNQAFNRDVSAQLQVSGRRVVALVLPVASADVKANAARLLELAGSESCDEVVETTVFGDPATELLVVRVRAHPIGRPAGPPRATAPLAIAPPTASVQREMPLNARSLGRLRSGELARQLVGELRTRTSP